MPPEALIGKAIKESNLPTGKIHDAQNPVLRWCCVVDRNKPTALLPEDAVP